jgi:hypothetical protein
MISQLHPIFSTKAIPSHSYEGGNPLFLSRVLGGERRGRKRSRTHRFLSRLFGGEEASSESGGDSGFLSRLFGGEV